MLHHVCVIDPSRARACMCALLVLEMGTMPMAHPSLSSSVIRIVFTVFSHSLTFGFDQWADVNTKRNESMLLFFLLSSLRMHVLSKCVHSPCMRPCSPRRCIYAATDFPAGSPRYLPMFGGNRTVALLDGKVHTRLVKPFIRVIA